MFNTDSTVTLQNPIFKRRRLFNKLMLALALSALAFGLFWLFWIIYTLIVKGGGALSLSLLTQPTPPPGGVGGLMNAIVGSVLMAVDCYWLVYLRGLCRAGRALLSVGRGVRTGHSCYPRCCALH